MDLVVIALVCSLMATPNHADCLVDNSLRHMRLDLMATNDTMCQLNGQIAAAAALHVDPAFEYVKVMCVHPSIEVGHMPG